MKIEVSSFCGAVVVEVGPGVVLDAGRAKELLRAVVLAQNFEISGFDYRGNPRNRKAAGRLTYQDGKTWEVRCLTFPEVRYFAQKLSQAIEQVQGFNSHQHDGSRLHPYSTMRGIDLHNEDDLAQAIEAVA